MKLLLNQQMDLLSVISVLVWQLLLISVLCRVLGECAVDIQLLLLLLLLLFAVLTVTEVLCSDFLGDMDTELWGRKHYASSTLLHKRNTICALKSCHMCSVVVVFHRYDDHEEGL